MRIVSGGQSDVGQQRTNNEDCFRIVQALNLFVVSDGMGGEAHGEIASAMAVETVVKTCMGEETAAVTASAKTEPVWSDQTRRLFNAAQLANKKIYESAEANPEQQGMGATLTAAWINEEKLSVVHVGDSRVYLLRSGLLQQLTSDHSLVAEQVRRGILTAAEAEHSELQSVLLRALGTQPEVEVDAEEHILFPGDILLLCTDGLTRMVAEQKIAVTLQSESDPNRAAEKLVALANENGGADNVTVVVVHMEPKEGGFLSWLRHGAQKNAGKNGSA
ncbi:MAG TPA: Stp1/IreP family PP2C-type Ser/Thr phosphatase [Candidatus Acidoferrales bacterium]|nr:Stp1/IreP family PP2C-type Ser/Thr phosphatase [Candidatus Acidoferrales bacterium]